MAIGLLGPQSNGLAESANFGRQAPARERRTFQEESLAARGCSAGGLTGSCACDALL